MDVLTAKDESPQASLEIACGTCRVEMSDAYFDTTDASELLSPPIYRAAYSDRMAWMMAEASRLAYDFNNIARLEPESIDEAPEEVAGNLKELQEHDRSKGLRNLEAGLAAGNFECVRVFSAKGTEAYLAKHRDKERKIAVLAFRGTELNFTDIKTDLNARFYRDHSNAKIHNGFRLAFQAVEEDIRAELYELFRLDQTTWDLATSPRPPARTAWLPDER